MWIEVIVVKLLFVVNKEKDILFIKNSSREERFVKMYSFCFKDVNKKNII